MIKFIMDGKEGELNTETNIVSYNGMFFDPNYCNQSFIAKVNKAIRQGHQNNLKLNIGCGFRPLIDMINLDYDEDVYPDIVRDLNEGLPFDSDRFEEIYSSHVIEHIKDVFFFVYEIWRVSKNKAKITIICPNWNTEWAIQPDHLRFINLDYFERWRPEHLSVQNELKQTRGAKFNIISKEAFNENRELKFVLEAIK
jgi:hypothetical protein